MASSAAIPDLDRLRPAGTKRSSKRDLIVNAFLKQEGHLSADDLVDLIKCEDHRISRATVYRTLLWMEEAGIARKVDFGEGRFRFEHSYRHPRHFHLICKTCNRSYEFLSSDIEALVEEVAAARAFTARQSVVQIYGTCDACTTGRPAEEESSDSGLLFARDALRIAIATERSGMEFYGRGVKLVKDARARDIFRKLATEEVHHLKTLEGRYQELLRQDPQLESRPTFLFFKGAANGLFSTGAEQLRRDGVDDLEAYRIGIRCERGSHRFFKRYGERFEDSEGKRIFLEFAEEEREHLELLIREYRQLVKRHRTKGRHPPRQVEVARRSAVIDLHMHTTASDGRLTPVELVARVAAAGLTTISVTDHDTVTALQEVTAAAQAKGVRVIPGIEITAVDDGRDVHVLGYFFNPERESLAALLVGQRALRVARVRAIANRLASLNIPVDIDSVLASAAARPGSSVGRPQIARELVRAGHVTSVHDAFDRWLAAGRPGFVPRTGLSPAAVVNAIHDAGGVASFAHPGVTRRDELIRPLVDHGLDAIEVHHSDHDPADVIEYRALAARLGVLVTGGSDFHGDEKPERAHRSILGVVTLPAADLAALEARSMR